jgi:DNA repair protein RadC
MQVHANAPWRALMMRVYEAKIVYQLVASGQKSALKTPQEVAEYLQSAFDSNPLQEMFYAVYIDRKSRPIARHMISLGTLTSALVGVREVFRGAILAGAAEMIVAHNHPSGDPAPSSADIQITRQLAEAAKIIGIPLCDHVIAGDKDSDPLAKGYFSFRATGLL